MAGETFHGPHCKPKNKCPPSHFESLYRSVGLEISHLTMIFLVKKSLYFCIMKLFHFLLMKILDFLENFHMLDIHKKTLYCMYMVDGDVEWMIKCCTSMPISSHFKNLNKHIEGSPNYPSNRKSKHLSQCYASRGLRMTSK